LISFKILIVKGYQFGKTALLRLQR